MTGTRGPCSASWTSGEVPHWSWEGPAVTPTGSAQPRWRTTGTRFAPRRRSCTTPSRRVKTERSPPGRGRGGGPGSRSAAHRRGDRVAVASPARPARARRRGLAEALLVVYFELDGRLGAVSLVDRPGPSARRPGGGPEGRGRPHRRGPLRTPAPGSSRCAGRGPPGWTRGLFSKAAFRAGSTPSWSPSPPADAAADPTAGDLPDRSAARPPVVRPAVLHDPGGLGGSGPGGDLVPR